MSRGVASLSTESLIDEMGARARAASRPLAETSPEIIHAVLQDLADSLRAQTSSLLQANRQDISDASARGQSTALLDRLTLTAERIDSMASGVEAVIALPDPAGAVLAHWERPNGLTIERVRVPIGTLGMIYESRPNVTIDAAALSLKSRNCIILRGGSESLTTSLALHRLIQAALAAHDLPEACVSMVPTSDRQAVGAMLQADKWIDVMIPRGGQGLIERVIREARMPVFAHLSGICHTYIHESANPDIARTVTVNAKMRRTGICGAMETLLLDSTLPRDLARAVMTDLLDAGCDLVGDERARDILPTLGMAAEVDWFTEYLDARLSIRTVDGVDSAIDHINFYGSHHTDAILAEDPEAVTQFLRRVDSAIVMHNTSTQFADGGEFGMGAEIGIGTGKLHARGPVGLEQLMTYKYIVRGNGQIRPV